MPAVQNGTLEGRDTIPAPAVLVVVTSAVEVAPGAVVVTSMESIWMFEFKDNHSHSKLVSYSYS